MAVPSITTIKLYRLNLDLSARNYIIEDIETFLASSHYTASYSFTNVMFIRHNLNISVKLNVTKAQMSLTNAWKYMSIQNPNDTHPLYYFIEKVTELSENTYKFDLHMDVINSYIPTRDIQISPRTLIHRQHKHRFNTNRRAVIDRYSENINVELFKGETSIISGAGYTCNYYLAYIKPFDSEQEPDLPPKPLKCFILSDYPMKFITDGNVQGYTRTIDTLNRAYPQVVKVIKLPYPPIEGFREVTSQGYIVFDNTTHPNVLEFEAGVWSMFKVKDNVTFDNVYVGGFDIGSIYSLLDYDSELPLTIDKRAYRNILYEPKLYHSDYVQPKFIYDSFSLSLELEKFTTNRPVVSAHFKMTNTITSRFMFSLNYYTDYETKDFEKYCVVQRNNEMTLLNDEYVNYIMTGYNYDVKNKTRQENFGIAKTALTAVGGALAVATGNPVFGALSVMGISSSLLSTLQTSMQNESNIEEKLKRASIQAVNVYGADDVDLMSEYAKNKLLYTIYQVSPKTKNALYNLFFYNGYISGEYNVPDTDSRVYFNYVSCDLDLYVTDKFISTEALNELKNLYKAGVYFMHKQTADEYRNYDWWDFLFQHENWEKRLFN